MKIIYNLHNYVSIHIFYRNKEVWLHKSFLRLFTIVSIYVGELKIKSTIWSRKSSEFNSHKQICTLQNQRSSREWQQNLQKLYTMSTGIPT